MPMRADNGEEMFTPAEAAGELGLKHSTVRVLMSQGRLQRIHLSPRVVMIPRSSLEAYRRDSLGQKPGPKSRATRPTRKDDNAAPNDNEHDHDDPHR